MPVDLSRYATNWREISIAAKRRAGYVCENRRTDAETGTIWMLQLNAPALRQQPGARSTTQEVAGVSHHTATWLPVVGFEGCYDVSSDGQVRRCGAARPLAQQILKGYKAAHLWRDGRRTRCAVHALVAAAFIGVKPDGHEINHLDGDRGNNRVSNLEYVTRSQNIQHAMRVIGSYRGSGHVNARLTIAAVIDIKTNCPHRMVDYQAFAVKYNVSPFTVKGIVDGAAWRHIHADGQE